MDMETLRTQIAERKREAEDKKLGETVEYAVKTLGTEVPGQGPGRIMWSYTADDLVISVIYTGRWDNFNTTARYQGRPVFIKERCVIDTYIPGPWEEGLKALHLQALEVQSKLAAAALAERGREEAVALADEAKKFGL
jgi:hypothetical protein